jgi:NAD(P)-dependent dehydrogenase (short-subunit alcohol dehydrogenase family)
MASSAPLTGTTALVTGGAGGLGKAIAKGLLDAGANVVVCDVHEKRLAETRSEFRDAADRYLAVATDITDEAAVDALFAQTAERFGRLDALVNNAGVVDAFDPVGDLSKANWDRVLGINLTGSFLCMWSAVRAMQAANSQAASSSRSAAWRRSRAATRAWPTRRASTAWPRWCGTRPCTTARRASAPSACSSAIIDTNIAEGMGALGGFNQVGYAHAAVDLQRDAVRLADVADYCVVLARHRGIASSLNGSCVPFSRNWPKA